MFKSFFYFRKFNRFFTELYSQIVFSRVASSNSIVSLLIGLDTQYRVYLTLYFLIRDFCLMRQHIYYFSKKLSVRVFDNVSLKNFSGYLWAVNDPQHPFTNRLMAKPVRNFARTGGLTPRFGNGLVINFTSSNASKTFFRYFRRYGYAIASVPTFRYGVDYPLFATGTFSSLYLLKFFAKMAWTYNQNLPYFYFSLVARQILKKSGNMFKVDR